MGALTRPCRVKESSGAAGRGRGGVVAETPHPLEVVEAAHFGAEQVHDHVAGIDQHPVGRPEAFDTGVDRGASRLSRSASFCAIDATCRVERPEAMTM